MQNKAQLLEKVNAAIESIRPYLKSDGGDILLEEITEDMVVKVKLIGACEHCPFSMHTLKAGIEITLRKEVPEIKEVIAI